MSFKRAKTRRKTLGLFCLSFGRHEGRPLRDVSHSYLVWITNGAARVPESDRWAVRQYIDAGGRGKPRRRKRPRTRPRCHGGTRDD